MMHRRRRIAFRLAAIILGCFPLLVAEVWLRYQTPLSLTEFVSAGGGMTPPLFVLNEDRTAWFIPDSRFNFFRPETFPANKPANQKRIFVLGGSTVQGRPFSTETSFAQFLELNLNAAELDGQKPAFDVINCGGVSYATHRVAAILREVLAHDPDAVVLYVGHNEFLEDREFQQPISYLVHWARSSWLTPQVQPSEVETRLDQVEGLAKYTRDDRWRSQVEVAFVETFRELIRACHLAEVPCIVCVPASDLVNTPPFKVELAPGLKPSQRNRCEAAWEIVVAPESSSDVKRKSAREILSIDDRHSGAHYLLGRLNAEASMRPSMLSAETQKHFVLAKDWDVCPLRATTTIEDATRSIADAMSCPVIDVPAWLDTPPSNLDGPQDGMADPGWFVDHVHPSVAGHQRIAEALTQSFAEAGWIAWDAATQSRAKLARESHLESLGEDYFARGKQRLQGLKRWTRGRSGQSGFNDRSRANPSRDGSAD